MDQLRGHSNGIKEVHSLEGPWGPVFYQEKVGSTNTWAKEAALAGLHCSGAFLAGAQGKGRGRLGRSWHSPAGKSLYLSMLIDWQGFPLGHAALSTLGIAMAARGALEEVGLRNVALKWPNDIVIETVSENKGQIHKLGGVLAEMVTSPNTSPRIVLGLGLNLNHTQSDFPEELRDIATSLYLLTGENSDVFDIAFKVLTRAHANICELKKGLLEGFVDRYKGTCLTLGRKVAFEVGGNVVEGVAVGLTDDASLIVEDKQGQHHTITAGDVRIRN